MKGYRHLLRWAALPVVDRRWAAPLSAVALGLGLFVGVAIGPGAAGTLATGAIQVIEVPGLGGGSATGGGESSTTAQAPPASRGAASGSSSSPLTPSVLASPAFEPLPAEPESSSPANEEPEPETEPPSPDQEPEPEPGEEQLKGVVVHVNKAAGSYVVAERGGAVTAVHAPTAPRPGTEVEVPARLLANGTYAEAGKRVKLGAETRAQVSGIVTYVDADPAAPAYTVSKRGVSMLVHVRPEAEGVASELPQVGGFVTAVGEIEKSVPAAEPVEEVPPPSGEEEEACTVDPQQPPLDSPPPPFAFWQRRVEADGVPLAYGDLAGTVAAVCPETGELLISADDAGESGKTLLLGQPAEGIDLARLQIGESILATATIAADGQLSLAGLAGDEWRKGADDAEAMQGDLAVAEPSVRDD